MKKFLFLLLMTLIITAACIDSQEDGNGENGDTITLSKPNVSYEVRDNGGTLRLSWNSVANAEGYHIYTDGNWIYSTTDNTFDATIPAAVYEVSAYADSYEGNKGEVDCSPIVTSNITVWGNSDPSSAHPSGLGFASNGLAIPYAIGDDANWPYIDYYFNDVDYQPINILRWPNYDEYNTSVNSGLNDFNSLKIAEIPNGNYSTHSTLIEYMVYSLWLDPDADGWDNDVDHFGKMKVESLSSSMPYVVEITCAYQPVSGLRWLVTQ